MSNTLTFRDIIDTSTGDYLKTDLATRELARKEKQKLQMKGYKARIVRSDYQLVNQTVER